MMAAYQPTPGVHPGLQHGHPGMAPNPGQHMGQPMQMHPGVSGAPHVSQPGAMMGMQPGAGGMGPGGMGGQHPGSGMAMQAQMGGQTMAGGAPNAQAMSHMTPQQMQQQQQQAHIAAQMQANPQFAMQQYQIRQRQAQMMQAHQQQQAANGMMNMQQQQGMLSQAQMAQLQQNQQQAMQAGVQLPPHIQQQIQLQQQRLAAQQHAQAQQAQAQQQQNQMAQQMAMQHANSQQSNSGQPGPPNPQPSQGQPQNPQQGRPPSRIANPNEQGQQAGQPQQHAPQQGQPNQPQPQQNPQAGQPANPQQQQAQQQQAQQQQAQQQQMTQQQQQQMQRQQQIQMLQRQHSIRQMQAQQAQSQGQQQQTAQGGMFILRLMNFSDHLSNFTTSNGKDISMWHNFVDRHFAVDGRLVHSFDDNSNPGANGRGKIFEVLRPTLPRYFCTYFESGANSLRLHTEHAREVPQGNGMHLVTCQNAILSVSYPNGARLDMSGSLHVLFSAGNDTIECFQFATTGTEETLTRAQIEKTLSEHSPTLPIKASPKMAKNKLPKAQQKMQEQQDRLTIDHFPKTPKGTIGITSKVQQFLEIGETMNVMSDLMHYSQEKKLRPDQALEALVAQYDAQSNGQGNPQINLPPNGMRTPSMQNMQMPQNGGAFSSPSASNLNLPMQNGMNGSPHMGNHPGNLGAPNMSMPLSHTPSPHQSNMAAPQMLPQHSQQGTNSSVASANTSPNVNNNNNKRRRSTVKLEGDDAGGPDGMGNANRVKPSPRMGKKSKP